MRKGKGPPPPKERETGRKEGADQPKPQTDLGQVPEMSPVPTLLLYPPPQWLPPDEEPPEEPEDPPPEGALYELPPEDVPR